MNSESLNSVERNRYRDCCNRINQGLKTCFEVGLALMEIRDDKLYREEFDTFEEFCQSSFQISDRHAYRLIESAEIKESPIGKNITNESQARAIAQVPEKDRKAVLKIVEKSGPITAAAISIAAEKIEEKKAAAPTPKQPIEEAVIIRKDAIGRVIPADVIPDWDRADQIAKQLRSCASEIKVTVERGLSDNDIAFAEITNPTIQEAASLHYTLSQIAPHAVCPCCQGKIRAKCQLCKKRGWISKYLWNSPAVSAETKALIEKVAKK